MATVADGSRGWDLLVIGGGLAGLVAGARAAQAGASVLLTETAAAIGGSAIYASFLWTAPDHATMRTVNPGGDETLGRRLVAGFPEAVAWVRDLGVAVGPPVTVLRYGVGHQLDFGHLAARCAETIRAAGGEVRLRCRAAALHVDAAGRVLGATLSGAAGPEVASARSTLLATGGFAGDAGLRERHLHPSAGAFPLRANPSSVGDGLRLGTAAGARFGRSGAGFYGHLVPSHVRADGAHELLEVSFFHSEHAVLVDLDGARFVDETLGDHLSTIALMERREARALCVYDQRVHDEWMMRPYVEGIQPLDRFRLAYRRGARCAVADELADLEHLPESWGYPGARVRAAVEAFNRDLAAGDVTPARTHDAAPLLTPPYYVAEVVPAITFPFGGLLIDERARVLAEDGTPVPGLLAAGGDAGGLWYRAYAGGAAAALVFGLAAAATAVVPARAGAT
jgi:succinate dehydrogenase/fumarate reductase flavoprotein subunit